MKDNNNPPKWVGRLFKHVRKNWHYHAPCDHVNMRATWDDSTKAWILSAAPIFQELYGGEGDGKRVWAGFIFEIGDFSRIPGVWIKEQAAASVCSECTQHPKIMFMGKFEGHQFQLHLFLEPIANTDAVEIVDTIKHEIREIENEKPESA